MVGYKNLHLHRFFQKEIGEVIKNGLVVQLG